jgi:hypothetical protein
MSDDQLAELQEALANAIRAMMTALLALFLVLAILATRAIQALFILARPAALAGTVVAAGYGSVTLFMTVLDRYGNDLPAAMLALAAVIITPATLLVLKSDSGTWAVMLAVAVIDFLVHLGIERAPPLVIAALPAVGLAAVTFWHLKQPNPEQTQGQAIGENEMKSGTSILVWIMTIALVIFSITCNYNILSQTLPEGQQIMGFFGLFALDFGLLCWLFWTTRASAPGKQRVLGFIMVIVDLVGVAAGILGDMMLNFDPKTRDTIGLVAVWVIGFVIVVNIAGAIATEITDPDQEGRDAERAFSHELTHQKARALMAQAPERAADIADAEAALKAGQMMAAFRRPTSGNTRKQIDEIIAALQGKKPTPNKNGNGTATYQKDAPVPDSTVISDELVQAIAQMKQRDQDDALAQAVALIEQSGGKVTRPRR